MGAMHQYTRQHSDAQELKSSSLEPAALTLLRAGGDVSRAVAASRRYGALPPRDFSASGPQTGSKHVTSRPSSSSGGCKQALI